MIRNGVIIFFYVDDIIIAYLRGMDAKAQRVIKSLQEKYILTGGDDLQ
jgi:hypothetical protein